MYTLHQRCPVVGLLDLAGTIWNRPCLERAAPTSPHSSADAPTPTAGQRAQETQQFETSGRHLGSMMPLLSPQRSSVLISQTRGSSDVKWISNAHLIPSHMFSLEYRRLSWRVCHERKHTSALLVIETLLLASQLAGRARRTTFSMFTNISTSPWCHHLIRSLAPLAPLWQPGEHRLTKPVSLRYDLDLRLEAKLEEWQRSHVTTSLFCRAPEFSLVRRNNELMRSIKNTGYLKALFFPNLADILEQ